MKQLNKKGFTLIEIIITLAIVITITTVAVGSYIGISNNKKKEEWKLVKEQIETAAEQYFSSNKNLYEDFDSTSKISAYISVGTLVDKDYLNKVVNPITKKEVPACSIVTVKIDDGKYIGTYDEEENKEKCEFASNGISFTEAGAASIDIELSKLESTHDPVNSWYDKGVNYNLKIKTKEKSIVDIKYCLGDSSCSPDVLTTDRTVKYELSTNTDKKDRYACFMVTTNTGKKSKSCKSANIDNSTPTCTAKFDNANSNGWTNKDAIVKVKTCSDSGVGCSSYSNITNTYKQETSGTDVSVTVKDKLDHSNSCKDTVRVDKTSPTGSIGISSSNSKYNSTSVKLALSAEDSLSGISSVNVDNKNYFDGKKGVKAWSDEKNYTFANSKYDGSKKSLTTYIYDLAGNSNSHSNNYTLYEECQKKNITYKDGSSCTKSCGGGTYNRIAYDKNNGAKCSAYNKSSGGSSCNTQSCGASSCSAITVVGKDKDCKSGAGNDITAQLLIKCDGKIDYINLEYYYPGVKNCKNSSSDPAGRHYPGKTGNTANDLENGTYSNGSKINGAVFNLRGCGATEVEYRYEVVADGKTIQNWTSWETFKFTSKDANQKKKICSPDKGADWFD